MDTPCFARQLGVEGGGSASCQALEPGSVIASSETHLAVVCEDREVRWIERDAPGWNISDAVK